mmetsp:Transcript_41854/g.119430  ORF Transcript_41854/g.119430 Transcript_41854/m.119430 type:complete len:346 (+) Transcript_41854:3-1040(+)
MFVEGCRFWSGAHMGWNFFDLVIVLISGLEIVLSSIDFGRQYSLTSIRLLRIVRTVRLLRVVRVMKYFRSLRILVYSVMNTLRSLVWTLLMLVMILYLFGIIFTQAVTYHTATTESPDPRLMDYYGSLGASILTLFKSIAGGVDWEIVVSPLSSIDEAWGFLFLVFFSFTYFAVLNVVTGVFCNTAIEGAKQDEDMIVQEMLANKKEFADKFTEIFRHMDTHAAGKITLGQLEDGLKDERLQAFFASLDLTVDEAFSLFTLLDSQETHVIDIDAFVTGCLKLRGNAKSIDVAMMIYQHRWSIERFSAALEALTEQVQNREPPDGRDPRELRRLSRSSRPASTDAI